MHLRQTFKITQLLRLSNRLHLNSFHILFTRIIWMLKGKRVSFLKKIQCLRKQMNGSSGLNKKKIQRNSISRSIIFSFSSCVNWLDSINWTSPDLFIQCCLHKFKTFDDINDFIWDYKKLQLNSKYLTKLNVFARRLPVTFEIDFTLV